MRDLPGLFDVRVKARSIAYLFAVGATLGLLTLVDMLCAQATAETARDVADKTWDLVHDRSEEDPVKRRVVECHEALARLSARGSGTGF